MASRTRFGACVGLVLFVLAGCGPSVSVAATRNPSFRGPLEPVTFVIFEGNTGPEYTEPLRDDLKRELAPLRVRGRVEIITGAEFNEDEIVSSWASQSKGLVLITPTGGTSYYGSLSEILYDVRALEMVNATEARVVWRARVDSSSGAYEFQIKDRIALLAKRLVTQLVADRVIPGRVVAKVN